MHFSKLAAMAVAAFFSAQALAAPAVDASIAATDESEFWSVPVLSDIEVNAILQSENPATNIVSDLERRGVNMCGQSTFYMGTGQPAKVKDCQYLANILFKSSASYMVPKTKGWHKIVASSSCQFGIKNEAIRSTNFLGATDIADVITDSLKLFPKFTKTGSTITSTIATKGRMRCYAGQELLWGLTSS